jgi:DNA-binding NtrC family response regulator
VAFHRVLIVEPDSVLRLQLRNAVGNLAGVDADSGVPTARQRLLTTALTWLVTNVRLDAYNGLHLAYLAKMAQEPPNILVYGGESDLLLAREAQQLGAFYESKEAIVRSLSAYLTTPLPASDRRDVATRDRRLAFRGGRRSSDFERGANVRHVDSAGAAHVRIFRDR